MLVVEGRALAACMSTVNDTRSYTESALQDILLGTASSDADVARLLDLPLQYRNVAEVVDLPGSLRGRCLMVTRGGWVVSKLPSFRSIISPTPSRPIIVR